MKIMLSISQSIVDASRLDLSSPAMVIHPLVLMNRAGDSQTGFDESNPYHRIILAKNLFSQQANKGEFLEICPTQGV
ncbi:MAG: hypothetical protein PVH61_00380 [Candidatus Aminicenantes bacterium]|jgi:hypothetical protein